MRLAVLQDVVKMHERVQTSIFATCSPDRNRWAVKVGEVMLVLMSLKLMPKSGMALVSLLL